MGSITARGEAEPLASWAAQPPRRRWRPFTLSLALHVVVVAALTQVEPRPTVFPYRQPTIAQILQQEDREIVWYDRAATLPAIAPKQPTPAPAPAPAPTPTPAPRAAPAPATKPRPRYRLEQRVTANAPNPQSARQLIVAPAPELKTEQDVELPNVLAWEPPVPSPPRFRAPAPAKKAPPRPQRLEAEPAPLIESAAERGVNVELLAAAPRLRYQEAERRRAAPARRQVVEAPAPDLAVNRPSVDAGQFIEAPRLRYQQRTGSPEASPSRAALDASAPQIAAGRSPNVELEHLEPQIRLRYQRRESPSAAGAPQRSVLDAAPPPEVSRQAAGAAAVSELFEPQVRLRYQEPSRAPSRPAPQQQALSAAEDAPDLAAAPPPAIGQDRARLAIIGVEPPDIPKAPPPEGSRSAAFTAGPDADEDASAPGPTAAPSGGPAHLNVPYLTVEAETSDAEARNGKRGPAADLERLLRRGGLRDLAPPPSIAPAAPAALVPDSPFAGRPSFMLAINMPNSTSASGSWTMEFAELAASDGAEQSPLIPPWPRVKVDPAYVRAAEEEEVEGDVVLRAIIGVDGTIENVAVVRSLDERLDASASQAFAKWQFEPATRDGAPVAVEALIRIPFRLRANVKLKF